MPYAPFAWVAGVSPLSAFNMNHLETQAGVTQAEEGDRKQVPNIVRWKMPGWMGITASPTVVVAGDIYYQPIYVSVATTYIRIGIDVQLGDGAGGVCDLRIFTWNAGLPDALVLSAGNANTNAAGQQEIVIAQALAKGMHYLACRFTQAPTINGLLSTSMIMTPVDGINPVALPGRPLPNSVIPTVTAAYADPAQAPTGILGAQYAFITLREN